MLDRFHHDTRAAIAQAKKEAARSGQPAIGTEHLLLGLLARPGPAADALTAAGADVADLRRRVQQGSADQATSPGAGSPEATPPGAGSPEAGPPQATPAGAGSPEAGSPEATPAGAGSPEAGSPEATPAGAGSPEAGSPEATPTGATSPEARSPEATPAGAGSPASGVDLSDPDALLLTKNAKRALERAQQAAQRLRHQHVSTGHVLLGVLDQPGSQGTAALTVAGIHVGMLRTDVLRRMEGEPARPVLTASPPVQC